MLVCDQGFFRVLLALRELCTASGHHQHFLYIKQTEPRLLVLKAEAPGEFGEEEAGLTAELLSQEQSCKSALISKLPPREGMRVSGCLCGTVLSCTAINLAAAS